MALATAESAPTVPLSHDYVKLHIIVVMQSWPLCELETESRRQWPFSLEIALHNIPDWKRIRYFHL